MPITRISLTPARLELLADQQGMEMRVAKWLGTFFGFFSCFI
jgi:hypothetical protein